MAAVWLSTLSACTAVTVAKLPETGPGGRRIRVTGGGVAEPYQSLGLIQVYRSGFYFFGWFPIPSMTLQKTIDEDLLPEAARRGADAVIHMRFHENVWTHAVRFVHMIPPLGLIPLPSSTVITGELVRFLPPVRPPPSGAPPPPIPGPAPPAAPGGSPPPRSGARHRL